MGYVDYCLEYDNGEVWSETRPFYDLEDMERVTTLEFCEALAEAYKAKRVFVASMRLNEHQYEYQPVEGKAI